MIDIRRGMTALSDQSSPDMRALSPRNLQTQTWNAVLDLHGVLFSRLNRVLGQEFGITLAKYDVLSQVCGSPDGITQGMLSRQLKVTGGNVSGLVRRLAADKLITREPSPDDRRAVIVRITEAGRDTYLAARSRHDALIEQWLSDASEEDTATALRLLRTLKAAADRSGKSVTP